MVSGILIISFIVIIVIIALTVIVTVKAYSVTNKEKIDPLPPKESQNTDNEMKKVE